MKIISLFSMVLLIKLINCQWIDPHDMNTNAKEKYMKPTLKKSSSTSSINNIEANTINSEVCFSHLKRVISVLINSAHIDKRDPSVYYGHLRFNIDADNLDFLMKFGKDDLTLDKLRRLDTVISESFRKSYISEYLETIESFQLKLYSIVVNTDNLWLLGAVFLLYVVYQLFKNNFSFGYIMKYLIILVLISDFGFRYRFLLEEAEEHNANISYSSKCDPAKMSWSEWTTFWLSNKDCERKTVTPLDAFLYQVKKIIIIPMHAFGTGMGGFGSNMFTSLPWGLNLIMWPLMLIFVIIVVVFTMVICTGQTVEFNIFYLIKLKFGGPRQNQNVLTGTSLERLMERFLHRPMIQNITVSVPSGSNIENQENESISVPAIQNEPKIAASNNDVANESMVRPTDKSKENTESKGTDININKIQLVSSNVKGKSKLESSKTDANVTLENANNDTQNPLPEKCQETQNQKI